LDTIFFIPGILGTELYLKNNEKDELVWPPTPWEIKFSGYQRLNALLESNLSAGKPISKVSIVDVYENLQNDLKGISDSIGSVLIPFGYDWRKDIRETAKLLSSAISNSWQEQKGQISLVAHSMGGLICRYLLESGEFSHEPWFGSISRFVGLAVPNLGSPKALAYALGLEGTLGLSGSDIARLSSDIRYASLYQLFPPPGQSVLWRVKLPNLEIVDHYSPNVFIELELFEQNIQTAKSTWEVLTPMNRPTNIRYIFLGGTGHKTPARLEIYKKSMKLINGEDAGDGTVLVWSAIQSQCQNAVTCGSHENFFRHSPARDILHNIFGVNRPFRIFSVDGKTPIVEISMQSTTYAPGDDIDVIVIPAVPTSLIKGTAYLERQTSEEAFEPYGTGIEFIYSGLEITLARVKMLAPQMQGIYRIIFSGSHQNSPDRDTGFFVTSSLS
jgi:phospholipase A1